MISSALAFVLNERIYRMSLQCTKLKWIWNPIYQLFGKCWKMLGGTTKLSIQKFECCERSWEGAVPHLTAVRISLKLIGSIHCRCYRLRHISILYIILFVVKFNCVFWGATYYVDRTFLAFFSLQVNIEFENNYSLKLCTVHHTKPNTR